MRSERERSGRRKGGGREESVGSGGEGRVM